MEIRYWQNIEGVEEQISDCQEQKHIQQVAYSSYHACLTQVCFTCQKIRTNINRSEIEITDKIGAVEK